LNLGSSQGDMAVTRLLERFGANVAYEGDRVTVSPGKLHGIDIDVLDAPSLVPMLAVVASVANGDTNITNAGRLRMKDSDRLRAVTETLRTLGADITEKPDGLLIRGVTALTGGTVPSFSDHRIVMMSAIASTVCVNPLTINVAEAVLKTYPGFFDAFEKLGGKVEEC